MEELRLWEKNNPPEVQKNATSKFDLGLIFGIMFIGGGLLLARLLWDMGYIGTLPFILVAAGVAAVFKSLFANNNRR